MNLSEKLAAADGAAAAPPEEETPPRNRRASDADGSAEAEDRRGPPGGVERRSGANPPPGKNPMRRTSDRAALDAAWKQSKQKVQAKVLAEIAPTSANLSPDELREKVRSSVNEILEREDIGITTRSAERRR